MDGVVAIYTAFHGFIPSFMVERFENLGYWLRVRLIFFFDEEQHCEYLYRLLKDHRP